MTRSALFEPLQGSVFMAFSGQDVEMQTVTVVLEESEAADGRTLDYQASREHWTALKGRDVFILGKSEAVGHVAAVEARDDVRRVFLDLQISDSNTWKKCTARVFNGAQARTYEMAGVNKAADRYAAAPGAIQLVDRPFEEAQQLRKIVNPRRNDDTLAALTAAVAGAEAALAGVRQVRHEISRDATRGHVSPELGDILKSLESAGPLGSLAKYALALEERLAVLEAQPIPSRAAGGFHAVTKQADASPITEGSDQ